MKLIVQQLTHNVPPKGRTLRLQGPIVLLCGRYNNLWGFFSAFWGGEGEGHSYSNFLMFEKPRMNNYLQNFEELLKLARCLQPRIKD